MPSNLATMFHNHKFLDILSLPLSLSFLLPIYNAAGS